MHTNNLFTHGSLRMQHVTSFGFFKIFSKPNFFFNHVIKTIKLCHVVASNCATWLFKIALQSSRVNLGLDHL